MAAGEREGVDSLLREVMTVLRKAYDVGRADALREAAAMLASAAPPAPAPAPAPDQAHAVTAPTTSRRRAPAERGRARRGRPDSLTEDRRAAAAALLAEGRLSRRRIANEVGVSPSRLYRWLKENGQAH